MESRDNDRLDRWLDRALRQYGNAESRDGLEGRILANLATERLRLAVRWRWGLAVASVAIACAVIAMSWLGSGTHAPHDVSGNIVIRGSVMNPEVNHIGPLAPQHIGANLPNRRVAARPHKTYQTERADLANEPRLEQFPSRRPLSEQEQLLKEFVKNSPQDAVLVAQMQAERQKELDRLIASQISKSGSEQQER